MGFISPLGHAVSVIEIAIYRGLVKYIRKWKKIINCCTTVSDKQRQASLKLHASLQQQQPKSGVRGILARSRWVWYSRYQYHLRFVHLQWIFYASATVRMVLCCACVFAVTVRWKFVNTVSHKLPVIISLNLQHRYSWKQRWSEWILRSKGQRSRSQRDDQISTLRGIFSLVSGMFGCILIKLITSSSSSSCVFFLSRRLTSQGVPNCPILCSSF